MGTYRDDNGALLDTLQRLGCVGAAWSRMDARTWSGANRAGVLFFHDTVLS